MHITPLIGERFVDTLRDIFGRSGPSPDEVRDVHAIARCVATFARGEGCDDSNTTAAVAWALRHGGDTLTCIRIGKARAKQLAARQHASTPPDAA